MQSLGNNMDITILHDRVLIKKNEVEAKTAGGIVLAGGPTDPVYEATVIKVGEGRLTKTGVLVPLSVKIGDKIVYDPTAIIPVKIEGENLFVIREENIFGILD